LVNYYITLQTITMINSTYYFLTSSRA